MEQTANEAVDTARRILEQGERHRELVAEKVGVNGVRVLDLLHERPLVNVEFVAEHVDVTFATANKVIDGLQRLGLLEEITGRRRNRVFRYKPYLALFTPPPVEAETPERREATEP